MIIKLCNIKSNNSHEICIEHVNYNFKINFLLPCDNLG